MPYLNYQSYQPWIFEVKILLIRGDLRAFVRKERTDKVTEEWTVKGAEQNMPEYWKYQIVHVYKYAATNEMWNELKKVYEEAIEVINYIFCKYYTSLIQYRPGNGRLYKMYIKIGRKVAWYWCKHDWISSSC